MTKPSRIASGARALLALVIALPLVVVAVAGSSAASGPRKVTAWLPYWDQTRAYQNFLDQSDLYSDLSPFWYVMTPKGTVQGYAGAGNQTIVSGARARGVRVVPTITNDFDPARVRWVLSNHKRLNRHVADLVNLTKANGYDGIDVDYEGLYAADRSVFSQFISRLGTALHKAGKRLTVAVHAKTSEPGSWSGPQAQDYTAIGAAADRVRIMTYDHSWATSAAGPVAPVGWVDDVARFAVTKIAPEKVELGMPLYGYDWVGQTGVGVTHAEVAALRAKHQPQIQWSESAGSSWFRYVDNGVEHTVWYADAASVRAALPIVDRYRLAGAAFWRLGGEDAGTWSAVRERWTP